MLATGVAQRQEADSSISEGLKQLVLIRLSETFTIVRLTSFRIAPKLSNRHRNGVANDQTEAANNRRPALRPFRHVLGQSTAAPARSRTSQANRTRRAQRSTIEVCGALRGICHHARTLPCNRLASPIRTTQPIHARLEANCELSHSQLVPNGVSRLFSRFRRGRSLLVSEVLSVRDRNARQAGRKAALHASESGSRRAGSTSR